MRHLFVFTFFATFCLAFLIGVTVRAQTQTPYSQAKELVKKNFDKIVPDKLKNKKYDVRVDYDFDAAGSPENFRYSTSSDRPHIRAVIQTIKDMYRSGSNKSTNATKMTGSLTVDFPDLTVSTNFSVNTNGSSTTPEAYWKIPGMARYIYIDSFRNYIKEKYDKTPMAGDTTISGDTVKVKFITDEQGRDPEIMSASGGNQHLKDFVVNMVKEYPGWRLFIIPGKIPVHTISVYFPIIFVTVQEGLDK